MTKRRDFLKQLSAVGMASCIPKVISASSSTYNLDAKQNSDDKIWACLMHLSFNFAGGIKRWGGIRTEFEPDQAVWDVAIKKMAECGVNMVLINLDDSVLWRSHPEISLKNSWTPEKLREELTKIKNLGIEPIPLLNFSSCHDAWMGKYSKMVSTQTYYNVCRDLIAEAIELFDTPRFIHFGMDEETYNHQKHFDYIIIRQNDLWWGDLFFYFSEAMKKGVRPWVWSDYIWQKPDEFIRRMPKSVVQSNWYYGEKFDVEQTYVKAYLDLAAEGYDQIPTGSNDGIIYGASNVNCIGNTVEFCKKQIQDKHLMGFMQSLWVPTIEKYKENIIQGIELIGEAKRNF